MSVRENFSMSGVEVKPGQRALVNVPLPKLSSHTQIDMPVHIAHGKNDGPVLFLSAAVHGDELNGVEIIRQILASKRLSRISGTLIAVPVVNAYGLIHESRYLPDRRDLNRSFPGSESGSLAARLAHLFMNEIVAKSNYGIDLHTGSNHRSNFPQIRADLDSEEIIDLAQSFGAPVFINSPVPDGSLREASARLGVPVLVYEAGEALRFDNVAIRGGVAGVFNVMRQLGMLPPPKKEKKKRTEPFLARSSRWTRAPESGMLRNNTALGAQVVANQLLGYIDDPFGGGRSAIHAGTDGVVIGRLELPIVYEGDAIYHIARFKDENDDVAESVESFRSVHSDD